MTTRGKPTKSYHSGRTQLLTFTTRQIQIGHWLGWMETMASLRQITLRCRRRLLQLCLPAHELHHNLSRNRNRNSSQRHALWRALCKVRLLL